MRTRRKPIRKLPPPIDGHYFFDSRWAENVMFTIAPLELIKLGRPYTVISVGQIRNEFMHGVETVKVLIDTGTKKHKAFLKRTKCGPTLRTPYLPVWS